MQLTELRECDDIEVKGTASAADSGFSLFFGSLSVFNLEELRSHYQMLDSILFYFTRFALILDSLTLSFLASF